MPTMTPEPTVDKPKQTKHGPQKVDWHAVMDTARANPGKFVRVPVPLAPAVAYLIKRGDYAIDPTELAEITTRQGDLPRGQCHIFLRTYGPDDE